MGMIPLPQSTVLRLTGRDVLTVLHRVSTQKLADLAIGEARPSLLCDFRGRLQHRFVAARMADDSVWLLRSDAPGAELAVAIDRSVFREEVRIEDLSVDHPVLAVRVQSGSGSITTPIAGADPLIPRLVAESAAVALWVGGLADSEIATPAHEVLDAAGAIAEGRARQGHEIVSEFNPFEVGLALAVHLDKGCFTGQEALQRLITYSSVRRQLVGVQGHGPVPETPVQILSVGADAGSLTSVAPSSSGWSGLAVLRRSVLESAGGLVLAEDQPIEVTQAFEPARPLGRP